MFHRHITKDLQYPYEHQNAEMVQLKQDLLGFERKKKNQQLGSNGVKRVETDETDVPLQKEEMKLIIIMT